SEATEQAMFRKGMEIHVRQRTMKKELEKLSSADEILAYRVGWVQE
ncbi:phage tail protein, partial [Escherichia coli]|nr:phage tail protein [Escherichia coli]